MSDWEEVKRLAADFQKVQLSSTTQKLSERNCVEIISWLTEKKIIDLIFTSDGKEYLTPAQLITDMHNELYVNGGRINLVELAKIIGVDLGNISAYLNEFLKGRKDIHNILGQLVDSTYITGIASEINEKLQQQGQITVGELTITYDLPAEFLQTQVIEKHLGKLIFGKQDNYDPKVLFTESFIAGCKAKLKGALAGLTRPTPVASILNQIGMSEKLFFLLFDQISCYGSLTSRLSGAQYIPNCYARSQSEWVTNFYKQNGYLEFDALTRIGILDYKTYLKKQLVDEDLLFLESSVVSRSILERFEADINECIASKSFVDLQSNVPSVLTSKDISMMLDRLLVGQRQQQTAVIEDFIISKSFVDKLLNECDELIKEKAKVIVESGKYQQYVTDVQGGQSKTHKAHDISEEKTDKREERRKKAAGGKSGGGTQGRETKTKSTKKHFRGGHKHDDDDFESVDTKKVLEIITEVEVKEKIQRVLEEEGLDSILDQLSEYILPTLNDRGIQIAANIFATTIADRTSSRRQTHNELQTKLNALIGDVRLFDKGIKLVPSDLQVQLVKYLLKTLCTDIVTEILNYVAAETMSNISTDNFNNDQRIKFVNELPTEYMTPLQPLVKSLTGPTIDDFMNAVDSGLSACSMILKKIDKKKDRSVILNHKHRLLEELNNCEDLALVLHLATVIIFTSATQCMLHASGRHVASLISFLKPHLSEEQFLELMSYHDFVTLVLNNGSEAENAKEKLKEKVQIIKNIANEYKKPANEKP